MRLASGFIAIFLLLILCAAFGLIFRSKRWSKSNFVNAIGKTTTATVVVSAIIGVGVLHRLSLPQFDHPTIIAAPFDWPNGCTQKLYRERDEISKDCMVESYAISKQFTREHGFDPGKKSFGQFYRIGNDAILFLCIPFTVSCRVKKIYHNIFI